MLRVTKVTSWPHILPYRSHIAVEALQKGSPAKPLDARRMTPPVPARPIIAFASRPCEVKRPFVHALQA